MEESEVRVEFDQVDQAMYESVRGFLEGRPGTVLLKRERDEGGFGFAAPELVDLAFTVLVSGGLLKWIVGTVIRIARSRARVRIVFLDGDKPVIQVSDDLRAGDTALIVTEKGQSVLPITPEKPEVMESVISQILEDAAGRKSSSSSQ